MRSWSGLVIVVSGLVLACAPEGPSPARPSGLVLVSLDTVRQDRFGAYGYERPTTPYLDTLAAAGAVFDNAIATSTQTAPSHASFFTGLHPHRHGVEQNGHRLRQDVATLAEELATAGWATGGFVSGYPMRTEVSGLDRGFEIWDDALESKRRDGRDTVARATAWLASARAAGKPFFLFVHLYDAHGPYQIPAAARVRFPPRRPPSLLERLPAYQVLSSPEGTPLRDLHEYTARYDTLIRYQDDALRPLLESLAPETLVVVTADHGETLGERSWTLDHGGSVWDEQIRIPLLVRGPGIAPRRIEETVEGVDLFPTLRALTLGPCPPAPGEGAPCPQVDGRDLSPRLLGGRPSRANRWAFSSAKAIPVRHARRGVEITRERPILAVRSTRWKLISYPGPQGPVLELYDLTLDPRETRPVADGDPDRLAELRRRLDVWYGAGSSRPDVAEPIDPEVQRKLRSLGYTD